MSKITIFETGSDRVDDNPAVYRLSQSGSSETNSVQQTLIDKDIQYPFFSLDLARRIGDLGQCPKFDGGVIGSR